MINKTEILDELEYWSEKYDISPQFWGSGNNNVYVCKKDIHQTDLFSTGSRESIHEVLFYALQYIERVNKPRNMLTGIFYEFMVSGALMHDIVDAFNGGKKLPIRLIMNNDESNAFKDGFDEHPLCTGTTIKHLLLNSADITNLRLVVKEFTIEHENIYDVVYITDYEFIQKTFNDNKFDW